MLPGLLSIYGIWGLNKDGRPASPILSSYFQEIRVAEFGVELPSWPNPVEETACLDASLTDRSSASLYWVFRVSAAALPARVALLRNNLVFVYALRRPHRCLWRLDLVY